MEILYKIIMYLLCVVIFGTGALLIFRCFKPKTLKAQQKRNDIEEIKNNWYETHDNSEQPSIYHIYEYACEFEKNRCYTRMTIFMLGTIFVMFAIGCLIEML